MIRIFFIEIALFHKDTFRPLNAAKGAQRLVKLVDPRAQSLLIEELGPR